MGQHALVVGLVVDIEEVPQVSAYYDAAKAQVAHLAGMFQRHSAKGIHMLVDESTARCLLQVGHREVALLCAARQRVEDVVQENVARLLLRFFQQRQVVARTAHVAAVAIGLRQGGGAEVDACQPELFFQVKMVVYGDSAVGILGQQLQKTLHVEGRRVGFEDMQVIQPFVEKCFQYLVFLHKECGSCHDCKFHGLVSCLPHAESLCCKDIKKSFSRNDMRKIIFSLASIM